MGRMAGNPWQDAKRKTEYLQARYASVSPCRFYDEILGHIEDEPDFQLCAMYAQAKKGQRMRRYDDVMDMLLDAGARRDAYVYPAAYYHSYALEALMQSTPVSTSTWITSRRSNCAASVMRISSAIARRISSTRATACILSTCCRSRSRHTTGPRNC